LSGRRVLPALYIFIVSSRFRNGIEAESLLTKFGIFRKLEIAKRLKIYPGIKGFSLNTNRLLFSVALLLLTGLEAVSAEESVVVSRIDLEISLV